MTGQERNYDEVLSRVLHSTTDRIEPVGDGLTKIQARLAEPWLKRQWWLLRSETATIGWVLAVRCQSWFQAIRSGSAAGAVVGGSGARASAKRPRHASSPPRISVGQAMAWLRPALAVAGAVVLVVAGVFALTPFQTTLFGSAAGSNAVGPVSSSSNAGGGGNPNASGSQASSGSGTPSSTQASASPTKASSTPSGKGAEPAIAAAPSPPVPTPLGSPAPSPTSASPTPTPTPSPTTTTTPTPTPSPTTSPPTPGTNLPMTSGPTVG